MSRIIGKCALGLALIGAVLVAVPAEIRGQSSEARWSAERANAWYGKLPWLAGANFIPSTAINQLEMWQADTFDPKTIDRELGWAEKIGFNCMRVFLHDLAWQADPQGFLQRVEAYLKIADAHGIRTIFCIFDACWLPSGAIGKQPMPTAGVHNSGWLQSPAYEVVTRPGEWSRLEKYVKAVVGHFAKDQRVLMWDVYNEPGNSEFGVKSLPLLKEAFRWARDANPTQPLTAGIWYDNKELNAYQLATSDVITFHNYNKEPDLRKQIGELKKLGRPVICTEWMARTNGSRFESHMATFKNEKVGCINWGLVSGKTNTIYPWGSKKGSEEPKIWFHDIFRADGTPFDPKEIEVIKKLTQR